MCCRAITRLLAADSQTECRPQDTCSGMARCGLIRASRMARSLRFEVALLLVLVAGCTAAPAAFPAQPVTAAQAPAPTSVPPPAPTLAPTATLAAASAD